jgi:general secretion pathway protein K
MIHNLKSKKGMALILVLGAISIMTAMAIEFAYNTNVNYHLALNELDRLKAQYLAESSYRFMQIELKSDRVFRQVVATQNLGQFLGATAGTPLCQQFPLSTMLIRAIFMGEGAEGLPPEFKKMVTMGEQSEAAEFLNFEGDFDGSCTDEASKINLNYFSGLNPLQKPPEGGHNAYDTFKITLMNFLGVDEFKDAFERADVKVPDVVRNIGDWIDTNEVINELDGVESGAEMSLYDRLGKGYPVKNGKMTTLDEAYLVDGVVDEWFAPLQESFTVYGDGGLVNVCLADDVVVQMTIRRYIDSTPTLPPVKADDPETMAALIASVREGCSMGGMGDQLKQQIAQSLDAAIGAAAGGTVPEGGTAAAGGTAGGRTATGFASYLTTEPRYFGLILTGAVGDTTVRIKTVIDVKEADPKKWKILYWRIY